MSDGTETGQLVSDADTETQGADGGQGDTEKQQETTFTQADVDRIVRERLQQQAKNKFGDYDDLKSKAGAAQTLEERLATLESELAATRTNALRTSIAAKFGISTEPSQQGEVSDADLFLTGSDEATLTAQAQRLAARQAEQKKQGNIAPREGTTTNSGKSDGDLREFTRNLFANVD